jgi:hypothetical protein
MFLVDKFAKFTFVTFDLSNFLPCSSHMFYHLIEKFPLFSKFETIIYNMNNHLASGLSETGWVVCNFKSVIIGVFLCPVIIAVKLGVGYSLIFSLYFADRKKDLVISLFLLAHSLSHFSMKILPNC